MTSKGIWRVLMFGSLLDCLVGLGMVVLIFLGKVPGETQPVLLIFILVLAFSATMLLSAARSQ